MGECVDWARKISLEKEDQKDQWTSIANILIGLDQIYQMLKDPAAVSEGTERWGWPALILIG